MSIAMGTRRLLGVFFVLTLYAVILTVLYVNFPAMKAEEKQHFKYPRTLDDAKELGKVLSKYRERHFLSVLFGLSAVYVMLQSFAIPGSIFLSILSGYLFPFPLALAIVCACSACGAAVCYFLSQMVGRRVVLRYLPDRLTKWQKEIEKHRGNLFNYVVFLRVTPILPNWFINIASPILDVPLRPFFFGTLVGVAPPSTLFIQDVTGVVWSWSSVGLLSFFAVLSLLPVIYKRYKLKSD